MEDQCRPTVKWHPSPAIPVASKDISIPVIVGHLLKVANLNWDTGSPGLPTQVSAIKWHPSSAPPLTGKGILVPVIASYLLKVTNLVRILCTKRVKGATTVGFLSALGSYGAVSFAADISRHRYH